MRLFDRIAYAVDRQKWVDGVADSVKKRIKATFASAGAPGRKAKDFLHGTWLGHPLHPVLVSIPIGAWTAALVFDIIDAIRGTEVFNSAADGSIAIGLVGAAGAVITGLTDLQHTGRSALRIGFVHGVLNLSATTLYLLSLLLRLEGMRGPGRGLSMLGYVIVSVGGFLGGHLAYAMRIGVNQAMDSLEEQTKPADYEPVLAEAQLPEGALKKIELKGVPILLVRQGGNVYALADTCAHLGCSLAEGKLQRLSITCRCHGSEFGLADGRVLGGPAVYPQPLFDVRVNNGMIEVRTTPHTWTGFEPPLRGDEKHTVTAAGSPRASVR
jgi:nitrite reductase/ring-hydroxylating ferredoxin subunit/uncharacterized membrane protein